MTVVQPRPSTAWRVPSTLGRGLLAGTLTGAALGVATVLTMLVADAASIGASVIGAVVVYGAFAAIVGGLVGALSSVTATVLVLVLHAAHPFGLGTARVVGGLGATVPLALLARDWAGVWVVGALLAAACAAGWMRWVVGLPRPSATMDP